MSFRSVMVLTAMGFGLLFMTACATKDFGRTPAPRFVTDPLRISDIVDTQQGRPLPFDALMDDLSKADVVFVGENHLSTADHEVQLRIAQELFARRSKLILALEMFPRELQPTLDRYSRGEISEGEFLKEVDWERIWGFPYSLYQPILSWAVENRCPIIGLNAPRDVVRKVSRNGLAQLDPADRSRLASRLDLSHPDHRRRIQERFSVHARGSIKDFESFYEAQLAWEETMAETLARLLQERRDNTPILVLIGKGHIEGRSGVPERTLGRVPHRYRTIVPVPLDYPDTINDPRFADFVWITPKAPSVPPGRLGALVRRRPSADGLEVMSIQPDSPAERAGLLAGDILLSADGTPLHDTAVLRRTVTESTGRLELRLKRKSKILDLPVHLDRLED